MTLYLSRLRGSPAADLRCNNLMNDEESCIADGQNT